MVRQMVTRWGMSERLGTISLGEREDALAGTSLTTGARTYSEKTASLIDEEVNRIVKRVYERAVSLLAEHRATMDHIARALRLYETLDAEQLRAILFDEEKVALLKQQGVRVAMLTGDSDEVARWVASELGIDESFAQVLPEHKSARVQALQQSRARWRWWMTA